MTNDTTVSLKRIQRETALIDIKGTAPLIVHAWDAKAKKQMLDSQQGVKKVKVIRDPQADYESSMYRFEDGGHGFPTLGFKSATVTGGYRTFGGKSVKMTELRLALSFITDGISTLGEQLTRIQGQPIMREDMVRVGMGTDLRFRAEYRDWSARLRIDYLPHMIDIDSIVALVDAGGMNGVGEWRPEKDGVFGTFEVVGA